MNINMQKFSSSQEHLVIYANLVFRDVLIQIIDQIIVVMTISSPPDMFLRKGVLKICSKFTGEHPCRNVISIKSYFGMGVLL